MLGKNQQLINYSPHLKSSGFAIEMEMVTKLARMGFSIYSVPISYHPRAGQTNLKPIHDGAKIIRVFGKSLRWKPAASSEVNYSETPSIRIE